MFADERVHDALGEFVCAADEVWRLQRGSEADAIFFQRAVNEGERITDKSTRQGHWIFASGGKLLARTNTRNPEALLETLRAALAEFRALPEEDLVLPAGTALDPGHRWEMSFPEGGLALERIGRELPDDARGSWNRDFAWFHQDELAELLPDPLAPGDEVALPLVAERLARFHLVDNVRGQTLPYAAEEVDASLTARVVAADGGRVELELDGQTRAVAADAWLLGDNLWKPNRVDPHGIACELVGTATWNRATRRFDAFELVAAGHYWGRAGVNGRGRDETPRGAIAFHLVPTDVRLAPTFVAVYDADWIVPPAVPAWLESPAECGLDGGD